MAQQSPGLQRNAIGLTEVLFQSITFMAPAVAVALTADNLTVLAVDRGGFITAVRIGAGTGVTVDCACQPEGLFPMGPSSFRLTGLQDGAFKLFDAALGEVLFAPVALGPGADGAGQ